MSTRAVHWIAGLGGAGLVHVAALAVLAVALRPEPVDEQVMPTSRLDVQAYQLERSAAQEQQPDSPEAATAEARGDAVDAGAIPQSRARPMEPPSASLPEAQSPAERLADALVQPEPVVPQAADTATIKPAEALTPQLAAVRRSEPALAQAIPAAARVASVAAPAAVPVAAVLRPSESLPVARPEAEAMPVAAPAVVAAVSVTSAAPAALSPRPETAVADPAEVAAEPVAFSVPDATTLDQTAPDAAILDQTAPSVAPAPAAQADSDRLATAEAAATRIKAALAFQGGDGQVDPVSVAAFQSFMQPGDVQASGDTLRDGVSALLSQVPCSRLQVGFDPETATLQVNGHIPEGDLRAPVLAALQAQMGADITVSDNILILPRPQCGALSGIGDVGLPQSTDQITNPLLIGQDTQARVLDFVRDQRLFFDITAPDYDAYVYVDYFDAGGDVLHLAPNDQVPLTLATATSALRIGAKEAGDAGLQILIGPPYGQEIAVAFAASEPLYDGMRPIVEPAAPYLEWLKSRVAAARAEHPDFKGEWVYFFVTTAEQ